MEEEVEFGGALSPRHTRFADEYLKDLNATQAYYRAGYRPESDDSARVSASKLLTKANVSAYIRRRQEQLSKETKITLHQIIREYGRIAFFDIRKAFNQNGAFKPIHELDDDTVVAISGIEVTELYEMKDGVRINTGRTVKIKLADRRAALYDLGRHLGMFGDEVELKLTIEELRSMSLEEKKRLLRQLEGGGIN